MKPLPAVARHDPADLWTTCAADLMQTNLVTVRAEDSIHEVERVLTEARVRGAPVLDDNDRVIGVISTTDLVRQRADAELPEAADYRDMDEDAEPTDVAAFRRPVADVPCAFDLMTTEVAAVPSSTSLRDICQRMLDQQVHRLLVIDDDRLVGLVSTMDVLRAIAT